MARHARCLKLGWKPGWFYVSRIFSNIATCKLSISERIFMHMYHFARNVNKWKLIYQAYRKLLEKQGRAHKWCTPMDPRIWPSKSRTTSSNIHTAIYVRIRDVALKTSQKRWMIGRSGERGSGISVLAARHDDDDISDIIPGLMYVTEWLSG